MKTCTRILVVMSISFAAPLGLTETARGQDAAFIGEIRMVAFNFPPRGWAFCNGQALSVERHRALFSLIGTTYGGDGRTTFALPDLRGRVPIHVGAGPGLTERKWGEKGGHETVDRGEAVNAASTNDATPTTVAGRATGEANNMQPYLGVHYIIHLGGVRPTRNLP